MNIFEKVEDALFKPKSSIMQDETQPTQPEQPAGTGEVPAQPNPIDHEDVPGTNEEAVEQPQAESAPVAQKDPSFNCTECKGEGLKDQYTVCPQCKGTGKV